MKSSLMVIIAAALLFVSLYGSIASAKEQENAVGTKDINTVASQAEKKGRAIERKDPANMVKALSSDMSDIGRIDQRIAQLEERAKEKGSLMSWLASAGEKILADAVGFSLFAIIVTLGFRRELKKTVREGLVGIGEIFANAFVSTVVPQIETFRNDAIKIMRNKSYPYLTDADLSAPLHVDKELESAQQLIVAKKYHDAEKFLKQLSAKFPSEIKIVAKLYELYNMPEFADICDSMALAKDCIHFLEAQQPAFSKVPDFYYFLGWAYTKFAGTGKHRRYYKLALDAADMAIQLEPECPRWHSLQGVVHDCFGVVIDAITSTDLALKFAEAQSDKEGIARAKNNLAYYYAELGQSSKREISIAYAREACQYDKEKGLREQLSLDTLGFVLMTYGETQEELEEAVDVLSKAVKLDPFDKVISDTLVEAHKQLESFSMSDC